MTQVERESAIEAWMTRLVHDGGIERYDDLHIDQIDPMWALREHWIVGGLEAYRLAIRVRDRLGLASTVALAYSLESSERPLGVDFQSSTALHAKLDWSPPSLYLFRRDCEPWRGSGQTLAKWVNKSSLFGAEAIEGDCYYFEFKGEDSPDYARSLFLAEPAGADRL